MELYIEASVLYDNSYKIHLSPISKCSLMLCKYPNKLENVKVYVVLNSNEYSLLNSDDIKSYEEKFKSLSYDIKIVDYSSIPHDYTLVDLPITVYSGKFLIYSGPAAVYRSLVQSHYKPGDKISVFGTAQSCLKACKEKSKWTLMCEKTIIDFINSFAYKSESFNEDILHDLSFSFKIHKGIPNGNNSNLTKKECHPFLEGPRKTLSDIVISFYILEYMVNNKNFSELIDKYELLSNWLNVMKNDEIGNIIESLDFIPVSWIIQESRLQTNDLHTFSLIDGLQKMNISVKNITELRNLISDESVSNLKIDFSQMDDLTFDWNSIPEPVRPINSHIPQSRQSKKSHQLLNMVKCANRLVKPGMTIVDFCSGGGHLGLIMASLHRDCNVILLENKEESLCMAEDRIIQSGLNNIKLYKCNIFAFKGHFDIGLALHACGSVTDLVIDICLTKGAHMVISPCCYGSIAPSPNVNYPRSNRFRDVKLDIYSKLCHAADCFNAKEARILLGNEAMNIIDSDRSYYVSENNYFTKLFKMIPYDCTPKNHILYFRRI